MFLLSAYSRELGFLIQRVALNPSRLLNSPCRVSAADSYQLGLGSTLSNIDPRV